MRLILAGRGWFGAEVFKLARARRHDIVLVTAPRRDDRQDRLWVQAELHGVPIVAADEFRSTAVPERTDLIVAAHAAHFISRPARGATRLGGIGYHPSLLPLHRGRDAIRWAIHQRERVTGGSVYWLTDTVDGGPLAAQRHVFVRPTDTARSLWERDLGPLGLELLGAVLDDLAAGRVVRVPQDDALATWEPSFDAQPLHRPELPALGAIPGYTVLVESGALAR